MDSQKPQHEGGRLLESAAGDSRLRTPLISIVTVVLNGANQIDRTIQSILAQSFHDYEFIVLDGGSTDGTLDIVRSYGDRIDYWRSEPDTGISDAFNKGIELARGTLVGLLNAGDWYEPETLAAVAEACKTSPRADIICGGIEFWENGVPALFCRSDPRSLDHETSVYHPTVFVQKSAYRRFGGYDTSYRYAMDYDLLLRFKLEGALFHTIPRKLVNMGLEGVSRRNWYAGLKEVRRARIKHFAMSNVLYYHSIAVAKNLVGGWVKSAGMTALYLSYWRQRNLNRAGHS